MIYPVNTINITQGYHSGKCLDMGWTTKANQTQDILAVDNATVYSVEKQPKGGNVIYLKHNDGKCSCYAHLSKTLVSKGDKVTLGQVIGKMGNSGVTTGPHLHFGLFTNVSVRYKNSTLDPFGYLEVYDNQEVVEKTQNKYGSKIKKHTSSYEVKYVIATDGLNVRKGPGTSYAKIKVLSYGTMVNVYETQNGWCRIGTDQWVAGNYLNNEKPASYTSKTCNGNKVRIRKKPSLLGTVIGHLNKGDKVKVYKVQGSWSKVAENEEKWVYSSYLK